MALEIAPGVAIDDAAIEERFVRSSGPGGQNVNKVATAVELRLDLSRSGLSDEVCHRLRALAGSRLTAEDIVVIDARAARTQSQNREEARARLVDLVRRALVRPRRRRKTRPSRASKERRLESKHRRASIKRQRSTRGDD